MHERDDLAEQLVDLIDNAAAPLAFDEVVDRARLGEHAPHPRRARRLVAVAVVMAVVVGAGVLVVESRHTTRQDPARTDHVDLDDRNNRPTSPRPTET